MNSATRISKAERFGHWLGRGWRGYMRGERRVSGWLVSQGLPAPVTAALVWVVKLAVLATLFYTAFWLAILLMFVVIASWTSNKTSSDEDEGPEWRVGLSGYGLYRGDTRVDLGDPGEED